MGKFAAQMLLCACMSVFTVAQNSQSIDRLSVTSLAVAVFHGDASIGSATGFVLQKNHNYYLVTSRHVVLTCAEDTNPNNVGGWICADKLKILHNTAGRLGDWFWVEEDLYDDSRHKRWLEPPTLGASADLVALPLKNTSGVEVYPLDLALRNSDMQLAPGDPVNIVGFPLGETQGGGLPIWKTGTIASDLDINYGGKAKFLVDATAPDGRPGDTSVWNAHAGKLPKDVLACSTHAFGVREAVELARAMSRLPEISSSGAGPRDVVPISNKCSPRSCLSISSAPPKKRRG